MIQKEIDGIRLEIGQVRDLLRDAIDKLTGSFAVIGALVSEDAQGSARPAKQLNDELSEVATALQFQDMVDQLLNHTVKRLDEIERAVKAGEALQSDHRPATTNTNSTTAARPVAQRLLDPGDVELF